MLPFTNDRYRGAEVRGEDLPSDSKTFLRELSESTEAWRKDGLTKSWITIPIEKSQLIPLATEFGFIFHHCRHDHVVMVHRIDPNAYVPAYATHYVGTGGLVLNDENELLVVSERFRRDKSKPFYKLPGGAVDEGEDIAAGAMREVLEETNIKTEFISLFAMRQWHGFRYGKSDLYIICKLKPLSHEITKQDLEIDECRWMPVEEYLRDPHVSPMNLHIVRSALANDGIPLATPQSFEGRSEYEFFIPETSPADPAQCESKAP